MARRETITYASTTNTQRRPTATFYLAEPTDVMAFYRFEEPQEDQENTWSLIDRLDRTQLLGAGNQATAKI